MSQKPSPPPRDEFDTIAPAEVRLSSTPRPDAGDATDPDGTVPSARGATPRMAYIGLAALVAVAILVFLLLPERTPAPPPADARAADAMQGAMDGATENAPNATAARDAVAPPFEQLRLQRERSAAQEVLERLLALSEALEARAVERWGAEQMARARALAEAGDELFLARDYEAAQQRYRDAVTELEALTAQVDEILAAQLERGADALADGDSGAASAAFGFAAAVDPGNETAAAGLARAAVLDEVLRLLRDARDVARDGALTAARGLIDEALTLDPDSVPARQARREIDERLRAAAFTGAMSAGYAALGAGRFDAARSEFERARTLRGAGDDAAEVDEALRITGARALGARIDALRQEAERLAAEEQWSDAAGRYAEALELDATLAFARAGVARAQRRAELDAAMVSTLDNRDQLSDDAALAAAQALLQTAAAVEAPGPRLAAQIEALTETVSVAAVPVPVTFVSDGATTVTLLRVARLGSFERRTLDLRPGAYVATGSRVGYRDVRVEFLVTGSGADAPVVIRCDTRI